MRVLSKHPRRLMARSIITSREQHPRGGAFQFDTHHTPRWTGLRPNSLVSRVYALPGRGQSTGAVIRTTVDSVAARSTSTLARPAHPPIPPRFNAEYEVGRLWGEEINIAGASELCVR